MIPNSTTKKTKIFETNIQFAVIRLSPGRKNGVTYISPTWKRCILELISNNGVLSPAVHILYEIRTKYKLQLIAETV